MVNLTLKTSYEINKFLLISSGAIPGALIRWQINNDLIVNLMGSFILGFVVGYKFKLPFQLLIGIGFCGSLTTFSSWIINCLHLLIIWDFPKLTTLIVFPVFIGLISVSIGFFIGSKMKSFIFGFNNSFF